MASLTGTWDLKQKNGGPAELGMTVAGDGTITLSYNGNTLDGYGGAIYAGEVNTDGQFPILMSIYSYSSNDGMGLSITNYTGVVNNTGSGLEMMGTAMGVNDLSQGNKPVAVFAWTATSSDATLPG